MTACTDRTVCIWDVKSGKQLKNISGHAGVLNSASFSPDGKKIVTASTDATVRIWDAESGMELQKLKRRTNLNEHFRTSAHHDIKQIADSSECVDFFSSAVFSPDGNKIVAVSSDMTALIWDAKSGRELRNLKGHSNWIYSARFSPDGKKSQLQARMQPHASGMQNSERNC